jgi:hypothetical protein
LSCSFWLEPATPAAVTTAPIPTASAAVSAAAATESATPVSATAAAAAREAAAAATRPLLGLVNLEGPSTQAGPLHLLDGFQGCVGIRHLYKAKSTGLTRGPVLNEINREDLSERLKGRLEFLFRGLEGQTTDIDLHAAFLSKQVANKK